MNNKLSRASVRIIALAAVFAAAQTPVRAELIVGLTSQNTLISFDSATSNRILSVTNQVPAEVSPRIYRLRTPRLQ